MVHFYNPNNPYVRKIKKHSWEARANGADKPVNSATSFYAFMITPSWSKGDPGALLDNQGILSLIKKHVKI